MSSFERIRQDVSNAYARAVLTPKPAARCCTPSGNLPSLAGYTKEALASLPDDAVANSFGCGNPVALAAIREGDTVLDLGSGAGIDLILAARRTGPTGRVIGVDMTPAMLERARANVAASGLTNIELRQGIIEALPVESDSVDLVISNCVINLSPEKNRVFLELARVLKVGGRISISDMVAEPMPAWILALGPLYSACISGAIPEKDYIQGLVEAGLSDVAVQDRLVYDQTQLIGLLGEVDGATCCGTAQAVPSTLLNQVAAAVSGKIASVRVVGVKRGGTE